MFTVKATYRSETRKLLFPDHNHFPSFDQLASQLYRVFPISHSYALSSLFFSPDSNQLSRMLIGPEVRSAEEYKRCLSHLEGRTWPNALLRFSIVDDTPPMDSGPFGDESSQPVLPSLELSLGDHGSGMCKKAVAQSSPQNAINAQPSHSTPPISLFHIPPPPIIFSSPPRAFTQKLMDPIDITAVAANLGSNLSTRPQQVDTPMPGDCCSVAQAKTEVQTLLSHFQQDLDRILTRTFGAVVETPMPSPRTLGHSIPSSSSLFMPPMPQVLMCSSCGKWFQGRWYVCEVCHYVMCVGCYDRGDPSYCFSNTGCHHMKRDDVDFTTESRNPPRALPAVPFSPSSWPSWAPPLPPPPPPFNSLIQPFFPPNPVTPIVPFVPPQSVFVPPRNLPEPPRLSAENNNNNHPAAYAPDPGPTRVRTPPPPPPIHLGIVCDLCKNVIEGVRHKCLDCPDYDLCTSCIGGGGAERHNPFHEFFEITQPGRVIVHTVFSGDGEMDIPSAQPVRNTPPLQTPDPPLEPVAHHAACDLCDSRITGDRYKCMRCPDFDTCASCFRIISEHHPHHPFVKISNPADLVRPSTSPAPLHFATCDACNHSIRGIRFKCLHPECPDYDLCEACEAHPIPMHPDNHPMLKMKSPDTVIPTVYRVGQTALIDHPEVERGRSRSPVPRLRSMSPQLFDYGYMKNPRRGRAVDSSIPRVPSPPTPPSPFYFDSNSRPPSQGYRSRSPYRSCILPRSYSPAHSQSSRSRSRSPYTIQHSVVPSRIQSINLGADTSGLNANAGDWTTCFPAMVHRTPSPQISERSFFTRTPSWQDYTSPESGTRPQSPYLGMNRFDLDIWTPPCQIPIPPDISELTPVPIPTIPEVNGDDAVSQASGTGTADSPEELSPSARGVATPTFTNLCARSTSHLLQEPPSVPAIHEMVASALERMSIHSCTSPSDTTAATESPITGEALLNRPTGPDMKEGMNITHRSLAALLSSYQTASEHASTLAESIVASTESNETTPTVRADVTRREATPPLAQPVELSADFIADVTVPDGQVFPPGAEFVKCWRMFNDSSVDWPETTELVFVAGEALSRDGEKMKPVKVGAVKNGADVDLWTGELKAPDTPGRYVGYWRLKNEGKLFGNSIWIDITVAETTHHLSSGSESMSSSLIVMPHSAPERSATAPSINSIHTTTQQIGAMQDTDGESTTLNSPVTALSGPSSEDEFDDAASDVSSASLLSIPSSLGDDEAWRESRAVVPSATANVSGAPTSSGSPSASLDFVLLYDDASSEEGL